MVEDPVADFIARLKNAMLASHAQVEVPYTKLLHNLAKKLEDLEFISKVNKQGKKADKRLIVELAPSDQSQTSYAITEMKRISKPARRIYWGWKEIKPVKYGHGAVILTTPEGILEGQEARKKKVGGEVLLKIW